jgi:galactonate dehydratase
LIEGAQLLLREGWNVIRTVPNYTSSADYGAGGSEEAKGIWEPWASIGVTARNLTKLREAIGSDAILGIDYHHRLSVAEAASFCQRMPAGTLDFLEEPIRDETPEAYEALRKLTTIPFAIGEEISSKWHFLPYIERGITNYVRLDVCNVGGLTESMKVAAMAEAHYIDLMPHNPLGPICTAATVHLAAAVPNFAWLEVRISPTEPGRFSDPDIFPVQPQLDGARFPVLDTPGLGIEVNEELIRKQEFKFWEAPHLRRRDGSYTNW